MCCRLHTKLRFLSPQVPPSPAVPPAALGASPPLCPYRCRSPAGSSKPLQVGTWLPVPNSRADSVSQGQYLGGWGWGKEIVWWGSCYPLCSRGKLKGLLLVAVPLLGDGVPPVSEPGVPFISEGESCLKTVGALVWAFPHL